MPNETHAADGSINWRSTFVLAMKIGLIGAILVVMASNLWVIFTGPMFGGFDQPADEVLENASAEPTGFMTPPAAAALLPDSSGGSWQVAGLPWAVSIRSADADEAESALRWWPEQSGEESEALDPDEADLHASVVELAELLGGTPEHREGFRGWRFERGGRRFRLVATGAEAPVVRAVGARVVWKTADGWRLAEAWPTASSDSRLDPGPPLPEGASLIAARYGQDGQLFGSLADCDTASIGGIEDLWRSAGWDVREATFLEPTAGARRCLIQKGGTFYLADLEAGQGGQATISYTLAPAE